MKQTAPVDNAELLWHNEAEEKTSERKADKMKAFRHFLTLFPEKGLVVDSFGADDDVLEQMRKERLLDEDRYREHGSY